MPVVMRWYNRSRCVYVSLFLVCLLAATIGGQAQTPAGQTAKPATPAAKPATPEAKPTPPSGGTQGAKPAPEKDKKSDSKGPSVDQVSPNYRAPGKDPFSDPTLVRQKGAPAEPVAYPPFPERQAKWRERRNYNLDHGLPPPDTTEQYLVDEFDVKGIFATDKGLGALMKVKNTPTTLFVREGSKFWNGSVTKIDKSPYRDLQKGTVAGTVLCSEVTLYSDKTVKTGQRPLTYIPKP